MKIKAVTIVSTAACLVAVGFLVAPSGSADEKHSRPAWAGTLTQAQGEQVEHMHHELEEDQAIYKQHEATALKELNEMTIHEDVEVADINAKIDELMAAKSQIMRLRYDHLVAMRRVLTKEQRVGYDESVLKRSAVR